MKSKKAVLILSFLYLFIGSRAGFAHANPSHTLRGVVITVDGAVVPEFSLVVRHVTDKPELAPRRHFKNGEFTIEGLTGDKYQLQITSPSYIPTKVDVDFKSNAQLMEHRIIILHTFRNERRLAPGTVELISVRKLQEKIPDAAREAYEKGVQLHRDGKLEEASMEYGKALRAYPNYVEALSDLATIFILYNRPESALVFLRRAQDLDESNVVINLNIALALTEQGDYGDAMKLLKKVLRDNPRTALANFYIARIHFKQKKYGEAREAAQKAIEV